MNPRTGFQLGSRAWVLSCPRRHLRLLPRDGTSEAALKVFEDLNGGEPANEINGKVGGTVYPVLYVTIGAGERCTTGSVTLRIRDEYSGYFVGTNTKEDISISLSSSSGWKTFNGTSWVAAQSGPSSTDNKEGATPLRYRYIMEWETHKKPLGNNGRHSVAVTSQIEFEEWVVGDGWTHEYPCGPAATSVTTENVWIGNAGSSNADGKFKIDYFKYDPYGDTGLAEPHIHFTITDSDPHKYYDIIWFRTTVGSGTWHTGEYWAIQGNQDSGGQTSTTINVSLADAATTGHLDPEVHDWGTYTFDIGVFEYETTQPSGEGDALDHYYLKCPYSMWVPDTAPDGESGHKVWTHVTEDGDAQFRVSYWINSQANLNAAELQMVTIDPSLKEQHTADGPTEHGTRHEGTDEDGDEEPDGVLVYEFGDSDGDGTWRVLWTATDENGISSPYRRTHDAVRMLVANEAKVEKWARYVYVYGDDLHDVLVGHAAGGATGPKGYGKGAWVFGWYPKGGLFGENNGLLLMRFIDPGQDPLLQEEEHAELRAAYEIRSTAGQSYSVWRKVLADWISDGAVATFDAAFASNADIDFLPDDTKRDWRLLWPLGHNCAHFAAIVTGLNPPHAQWPALNPALLSAHVENAQANGWLEYLNDRYYKNGEIHYVE